MLKEYVLNNKTCRERIRGLRRGEIRNTKRLSQEKLADKLRLQNSKISRDDIKIIELGKRDVFDIEIVWFAKFFDVSIAYLIGISDDCDERFDGCDPTLDTALKDCVNVCGKWVKYARSNRRRITQDQLALMMRNRGFDFKTHTAISHIESGSRRIRLSELKAFSEILGMPLLYFFKGENKRLPNIESFESYVAQDD